MGEISHKAPSFTWVNSLFSTSVGLFNQIVCFFFVPLKKTISCLETLQGPLEGTILVIQRHEIVFYLSPFSEELFWGVFTHFCASILFLSSYISWESYNHFTIKILTYVLGITRRVTWLKNLFAASLPLLGAICRSFGGSFWGVFNFILRAAPSYLMKSV